MAISCQEHLWQSSVNSETCLLDFLPCYSHGVSKSSGSDLHHLPAFQASPGAAGSFCHTSLKPLKCQHITQQNHPPAPRFISLKYPYIQRTGARRNLCFPTNSLRALIIMKTTCRLFRDKKTPLPKCSERTAYCHLKE